MNLKVHILGKGYKGTKKGPIRVNHYIHTPMMVGDEALVLSKYFPCWISGKRLVALQKIIAEKADTIILDDGLQDTSIYKDFSILVINQKQGLGNGRLIPSGPLRETLFNACKKSNCVLLIDYNKNENIIDLPLNLPVFFANINIKTKILRSLKGKKVVAFSGIAFPQKFKDTLISGGINVFYFKPFNDHHFYKTSEIKNLIEISNKNDAICVTTEKDYVKLSVEDKKHITCIEINLKIKNQKLLQKLIHKNIRRFI